MKPKKKYEDFTKEDIIKYRQQFVKNVLRRSTYRWPWKNIAMRAAKIGRNQYVCALCKNIVPNRLKKVDHINPVVSPAEGFVSWDMFIERLLCPLTNFQVVCKECHDQKTKAEREERKKTRASRRLLN